MLHLNLDEANVHTDGLQLLHLSLDEANVHTDGLQLLHFASQFQNGKNHPNRTRGSKVRGSLVFTVKQLFRKTKKPLTFEPLVRSERFLPF